MVTTLGLDEPRVKNTLDRLYEAARGDRWVFARALPFVLTQRLRGVALAEAVAPYLDDAYIPISRDAGRFLFLTAHLVGARRTVEFGTSFGISAIFLAAAMRDLGGRFVGSEMVPAKLAAARRNLAGSVDGHRLRSTGYRCTADHGGRRNPRGRVRAHTDGSGGGHSGGGRRRAGTREPSRRMSYNG